MYIYSKLAMYTGPMHLGLRKYSRKHESAPYDMQMIVKKMYIALIVTWIEHCCTNCTNYDSQTIKNPSF